MYDVKKKFAFVTIVGRPNVGKSSFLNLAIGQKVSIVSSKPQTTRTRITGVLTQNDVQLIFIDTPGIYSPHNVLEEHMIRQVNSCIIGVDVCILMVQAGKKIFEQELKLIERFKELKVPVVLVLNKIDLLSDKTVIIKQIEEYTSYYDFKSIIPISVKKNNGISRVLLELQKLSHHGGYIFDDDYLTDQPERVLISEIIREKLLRYLDKEVPHGIAVQVEYMKERKDKVMDIYATIFCEKATHKGIIIGKHGEMLKKIGILSRRDIEKFFNYKVNLKLWTKIKENWRNRENLVTPFIHEDFTKTHF